MIYSKLCALNSIAIDVFQCILDVSELISLCGYWHVLCNRHLQLCGKMPSAAHSGKGAVVARAMVVEFA